MPTTDISTKYWINLYYSILFLGSNELGPVTVYNLAIAVAILMICAFVNAFVLGDMASVVATLSAGYKTEMQIQAAHEIYDHLDLAQHLQSEINNFFR